MPQLSIVSEYDGRVDVTNMDSVLHRPQSVGCHAIEFQFLDRFFETTLHEQRFQGPCLISLGACWVTLSRFVEPIDEIGALLHSFCVQEVGEFGEEDPSVVGARIVIGLVERVKPLVETVVAQVVIAGESLCDFQLIIFYAIVEVMI